MRELALAIGRSDRCVRDYLPRGLPRRSDGSFVVVDCLAWIKANIHPTGRACDSMHVDTTGDDGFDRAYWEKQKTRFEALNQELKFRAAAGELIEVDLVAREAERRISHAKALFEQIPDRLLGLLPKEVKAAAKKAFRERTAEMLEDVLFALSAAEETDTDGISDDPGITAAVTPA